MAYERVHSEATSNARRAREGERRREKEGEGTKEQVVKEDRNQGCHHEADRKG